MSCINEINIGFQSRRYISQRMRPNELRMLQTRNVWSCATSAMSHLHLSQNQSYFFDKLRKPKLASHGSLGRERNTLDQGQGNKGLHRSTLSSIKYNRVELVRLLHRHLDRHTDRQTRKRQIRQYTPPPPPSFRGGV